MKTTQIMILELTTQVENLKAELGNARRIGAGAMELLALQNKLCNAIDMVVLCMSDITNELESKLPKGGNS